MNRARNFWDKQARRFDDSQKEFETASGEIISRTKEYLNAGTWSGTTILIYLFQMNGAFRM